MTKEERKTLLEHFKELKGQEKEYWQDVKLAEQTCGDDSEEVKICRARWSCIYNEIAFFQEFLNITEKGEENDRRRKN